MTVEAFAPAKINLTLHVTGQRADGYHLLDSLVIFADVGDRITVSPAKSPSLTVSGPKALGVPVDDSNLVARAAKAMGVDAAIHLEKHLPAAAGIGGGSSDAAATLRALSELSERPLPAASEILSLGADVPLCLHRGMVRMQGIGERLTELGPPPALHLLLVNPGVDVATPVVFRALRRKDNPPMDWPMPKDGWLEWLAAQRNDLEAPAIEGAPAIREVLEALRAQPGCQLARMSGSGATCFAILEDADALVHALGAIRTAHPDWWSVACKALI